MRKNIVLVVLLLVAAGVLLGIVYYGSSTEDASGSTTLSRYGDGFRSRFVTMHSTQASGTATIEPVDGGFTIDVVLEGLKPNKRYNTHYHRGTCREPGGGGMQLNSVMATDAGTGVSHNRVDYAEFNTTFDHLIMVHAPDQHHVLCGDVPSVDRLKELRDLDTPP